MVLNFDKISFRKDLIEITRDNWIVGYENVMKDNEVIREIHYCVSEYYLGGILIDDVWSDSFVPHGKSRKEDVYILAPSISPHPLFTLDKRHSFFLKTKDVNKSFVTWEQLKSEEKEILKKIVGGLRTRYEIPSNRKPILSIITTVFNNAFLLEQTIQSVVNQTSREFEYIIKDALSNDEFGQIVEKYKKYGIRIIRGKDKGIYDGMDQGIRASKGEYVQILNSDDVFYNSDVISNYIQHIRRRDAEAFCSDIEMHFPNGYLMRRNANLRMLPYRSCINHTSLALRLTDYVKAGGFDLSLSIAADADLTIKIIKNGVKIKHLNMLCVKFRAEGVSNSGYNLKMLKENLVCRYRYSKWNFMGYVFTLLQYCKHQIKMI